MDTAGYQWTVDDQTLLQGRVEAQDNGRTSRRHGEAHVLSPKKIPWGGPTSTRELQKQDSTVWPSSEPERTATRREVYHLARSKGHFASLTMDVEQLHIVLQQSFAADAGVRKPAEETIRNLKNLPGSVTLLLQVAAEKQVRLGVFVVVGGG